MLALPAVVRVLWTSRRSRRVRPVAGVVPESNHHIDRHMVRQLTAIMFTDMVGYTALMQENEHQAKLNRDRHREILERLIASQDGRILQFYGDGTLSVFQSAIAAVHCAIEVQSELRSGADPIPLRIGLHTGDVVHDEGGVYGDGVNVASRIEGLGVAGAVLISEKVFDEVKNQPDIQTQGLGQFNLKNVKRSMEVYAIANDGLKVPDEATMRPLRAGKGKSIAVLPFVNMSPDPENEFFSDGMTDEIINALVRINGLQVTARTSSFAFKNHNKDIREIAEELGVTHILEGSVRRASDRVRVTAQLICAKDGYHLFSESFDGGLDDVFALQDQISTAIVDQLASHLGPVNTSGDDKGEQLVHSHTHDTEAYAEYLKGRFEWARWTPEAVGAAISHYERSIEMDPECVLPHVGMAAAHVFMGAIGYLPPEQAFKTAEFYAERALQLDEGAGEAHTAMAAVRFFYHWDWKGAYRSFQKAISLTPGSAEAHQLYGMYLRALGELEESADELRTAVALDPLSFPIRDELAKTLGAAGKLDEAEAELKAILGANPSFRAATETLGWLEIARGNPEAALAIFDTLPLWAGHRFAAASSRGYTLATLGRTDEAHEMLALLEQRQSDHPDLELSIDFALVYQGIGDYDQVFHYLDDVADKKMGAMVFLAKNLFWGDEMRTDARFDALLERIGHPMMVGV